MQVLHQCIIVPNPNKFGNLGGNWEIFEGKWGNQILTKDLLNAERIILLVFDCLIVCIIDLVDIQI